MDITGDLSVSGEVDATTRLTVSGASPRINLTDTDTNYDSRINADSSVGNVSVDVDINSEATAPSFIVNVQGSEAMRVDSSGNVGIGTPSPATQLHNSGASGTVQTRTSVTGSTSSDVAEVAVSTGSRTYLMQSKGSSGSFVLRDSTGAADRMTIDSSGAVGIGTTSPGNLVDVHRGGGGAIIGLQRSNTNTTGRVGAVNFKAFDGHSVAAVQATGDGNNEGAHLVFYTTSAASGSDPQTNERLRISSLGSVLASSEGSNTAQRIDLRQGSAKVWTNIRQYGGNETRDSYNQSSFTDNGTGDFTVNINNDMNNRNYSYTACGQRGNNAIEDYAIKAYQNNYNTAHNTGSLRMVTMFASSASHNDMQCNAVQICGDLA